VSSPILRRASDLLHPLLLLLALYLTVAGHDEPGGGFAGGLVAGASYALCALAHGVGEGRRRLPGSPLRLLASGLGAGVLAAAAPVAVGRPLLTALWLDVRLPAGLAVKAGTPYLFEAGVFLTVVGAVLTVVFGLMEEG